MFPVGLQFTSLAWLFAGFLTGTYFGLIFGSRLHPRRMPTSPGSHKFPPIVGRGSGGTYHEAAGFIRAGLSMVVCEKVRPPPDLPSVNQPVLVACVM